MPPQPNGALGAQKKPTMDRFFPRQSQLRSPCSYWFALVDAHALRPNPSLLRGTEEARMTQVELTEEILRTRIAPMRAAGSMWDPALARARQEPQRRAR
jgi:hypothetical protein